MSKHFTGAIFFLLIVAIGYGCNQHQKVKTATTQLEKADSLTYALQKDLNLCKGEKEAYKYDYDRKHPDFLQEIYNTLFPEKTTKEPWIETKTNTDMKK